MNNDNPFQLLDLPFPFKAAISICSDIDGTSWNNFLLIHKFLNSNQNTPLGKGLSLPVGDSFWFYDNPEYPNAAFSYFKPDKITPTDMAPQIRLLIRAGILDVMHGYGNFISEGEFSRRLALRALKEFEKHSLKIDVWTNHGGEESVQNIGALSSGKGDVPDKENRYFHSDLLLDFGVKFYWDSEQSLTPVVGQDRKVKWAEYFLTNPVYFSPKEKTKAFLKGVSKFVPDFLIEGVLRRKIITPDTKAGNDLILMDRLRDGKKIFRFRRFGLGRYDWSDDLPNILNDKVLQKLLRSKGKMIVYVHLGDLREKSDNLPLSQGTIEKFRQISDLFHRKILWVATTRQLLNFSLLRKYLDWTVAEIGGKYVIRIHGLKKMPVPFELERAHLGGVSFSLPSDREALLFFKEKKIPFDHFHIQKNNTQILKIPVETIEWPL